MKITRQLLNVNYTAGRGGQKVQLIVIHRISKPGITYQSALNEFRSPVTQKSAHEIILYNGDVIELVDENDTAYTNGIVDRPTSEIVKYFYDKGVNINKISYAIELEGNEDNDLTPAQYDTLAKRVKEKCLKFELPITSERVIPHFQIRKSKVCPGKVNMARIIVEATKPPVILTPQQKQSLLNVIWAFVQDISIVDKIRVLLGGSPTFGAVRSSGWSSLQKETVAEHPFCAFHGGQRTLLNPLNVHHIKPFHLFPELELVKSNLIVACRFCHLWYCHLGSWKSYNLNAREDAEVWIKKIESRP